MQVRRLKTALANVVDIGNFAGVLEADAKNVVPLITLLAADPVNLLILRLIVRTCHPANQTDFDLVFGHRDVLTKFDRAAEHLVAIHCFLAVEPSLQIIIRSKELLCLETIVTVK